MVRSLIVFVIVPLGVLHVVQRVDLVIQFRFVFLCFLSIYVIVSLLRVFSLRLVLLLGWLLSRSLFGTCASSCAHGYAFAAEDVAEARLGVVLFLGSIDCTWIVALGERCCGFANLLRHLQGSYCI